MFVLIVVLLNLYNGSLQNMIEVEPKEQYKFKVNVGEKKGKKFIIDSENKYRKDFQNIPKDQKFFDSIKKINDEGKTIEQTKTCILNLFHDKIN